VNCRTNHLHVVVTANRHPDEVREQLKAWCTRKLKALARARQETPAGRQRALSNSADGDGQIREHWWAERGSKRYLNDADSLEAAVLYVRDGQDRRP
jgi:hypothetical protein